MLSYMYLICLCKSYSQVDQCVHAQIGEIHMLYIGCMEVVKFKFGHKFQRMVLKLPSKYSFGTCCGKKVNGLSSKTNKYM